MGRETFSVESYRAARREYEVESDSGVTRRAEQRARDTGRLNEIVDPGVKPMRYSKIRLNPHQKKWIATVGCPMDIEVSCDTTGSMGGEVDTEMAVLPELYEAVAKVLPGYDPQLCLGIFGDCDDDFVICRPQFEMEAPKIVNYLKEMAPQRAGGDYPEDPQYAMFARAYLTDAYTNHIGLKGYHFIVTDSICHRSITKEQIKRIFGKEIFENELKNMEHHIPNIKKVIKDLKKKTHQFILLLNDIGGDEYEDWRELCGEDSVICIDFTENLPAVISTIIGLTEGTIDITEVKGLRPSLIKQLSKIKLGAQAELRHKLPHPVPKAGDIFAKKSDLWPIQPSDCNPEAEMLGEPIVASEEIEYL